MTTITQLGHIKISVYADDHNPPHCHVTSPEADAVVRIKDMTVIGGDRGHAHVKIAVEWAKRHAAEIALAWVAMNG